MLTTPHCKKRILLLNIHTVSPGPGLRLWYELSDGKGTWNVRSQYRSGSLTAAARELARYKLDLVDVQAVRWDKGGTAKAVD